MGIRDEISQMVRGLCKQAQAPVFVPRTGNEVADAYANLGNLHLLRGVARGTKNLVPDFIDGTIGSAAGLINGAGQWLGGGSFLDGWDESNDFVQKHYTDPIRKAEMALGGKYIKKMFDGAQKYHQNEIGKVVDTNNPMHLDALQTMANMENGAYIGSQLVMTPAALGVAGKIAKVPTMASKANTAMNTARKLNRLKFVGGVTAAPYVAPTAVDGYRSWDYNRKHGDEDYLRKVVYDMGNMDASSDQYRQMYDYVMNLRKRYPIEEIDALVPPTHSGR